MCLVQTEEASNCKGIEGESGGHFQEKARRERALQEGLMR